MVTRLTESNESIRNRVMDFIYDLLDSKVESNLALTVASAISDYDPEWSPADASEVYEDSLEIARDKYIKELVKILLQNQTKDNQLESVDASTSTSLSNAGFRLGYEVVDDSEIKSYLGSNKLYIYDSEFDDVFTREGHTLRLVYSADLGKFYVMDVSALIDGDDNVILKQWSDSEITAKEAVDLFLFKFDGR